jgi:hypothetical protein
MKGISPTVTVTQASRSSVLTLVVALVAAMLVSVSLTVAQPAAAAPGQPVTAGSEGGDQKLREELDAASRGYNDANARLETSKNRQAQLNDKMRGTENELAVLSDQVGAIATAAYKGGGVTGLTALLDSESPDGMFERALSLDSQARSDGKRLAQAKRARTELANQQNALAGEMRTQQDQLAEMDKRKKAAEKALAPVGGNIKTAGPTGGGGTATAAPRKADGTLASEGCTIKDPTTSGCISPRMLNALNSARAAGFTHFTSCYRSQEDGGEHPRGRACDFAAAPNGFGGVAAGADKQYGDRLAAYFLANSTKLGVLYVIWFNQIWLPSSGWRAYNGGSDPSSSHRNHVHLSVQ